jgi:hypothetical protein
VAELKPHRPTLSKSTVQKYVKQYSNKPPVDLIREYKPSLMDSLINYLPLFVEQCWKKDKPFFFKKQKHRRLTFRNSIQKNIRAEWQIVINYY